LFRNHLCHGTYWQALASTVRTCPACLRKSLNWHGKRWPQEVDFWYLKQALGVGDVRVQP